ncbi:MAG: hypothetical protein ABSC03_05260 [Verrucomicrobiota bacterium]|jgi:hypothetical protein
MFFLGCGWCLPPALAANATNAPSAAPAVPAVLNPSQPNSPALIAPALQAPAKATAPKVEVGGAVPDVTRSRQPLQMVSPLAPRECGDGSRNVVRNWQTGRAEGVALFSFSFPSKAAKTPKKPKAKPAANPAPPKP